MVRDMDMALGKGVPNMVLGRRGSHQMKGEPSTTNQS